MLDCRLLPAIERFLAWARVNRAPATVYGYSLYLRRFATHVGNVPLPAISPAMLTTWSNKFHAVQAVQRLLAFAQKEERSIANNPLSGMRKIATGCRRRVLVEKESRRMIRSAEPFLRRLLIALRETFARPQEMRSVRAVDVRQAGGAMADAAALREGRAFFQLDNGKGFDRRADRSNIRIIPISPRLGRLILRILAKGGPALDPLFRNSLGRPWTGNAVRCRFRRLRDRLELGEDARGERVVAYSFRHTGATACARAGLRDFRLAAVLGHATTRTTARYVHLQAQDVLDGMKEVWDAQAAERAKNDRLRSRKTRPD